MAGPILICYDGSFGARNAVVRAAELFAPGDAVVLSVWPPAAEITPLDPVGDAVGRWTGIYREMDAAGADLAHAQASEGAQLARESGLDASPETAMGEVWREILRVADDHDVAVIVVGARGVKGMERVLLGSVSDRVLHHSRRPVLVFPAAD
jgi:nucleotide-binding universal stress UspA family protein